MKNDIFTEDFVSQKEPKIYGIVEIKDYATKIEADTALNDRANAKAFAADINANKYADFEKEGDQMCHVSTFMNVEGTIYVTYYANTSNGAEDPNFQVARIAYCPENEPENQTVLDVQAAGDSLGDHHVDGVYDTIMMCRPDEPKNIYILWTANIDGRYYRLYRVFNIETKTMGDIGVNRFKVGEITNDFSFSGMQNALTENGIGYKEFFADIGIMQKQSWRVENGVNYCYSGAYSGNFTCIIKSADLITWEYVAQPNEGANGTGFENETKWENAVYVLEDKVYYFVRQWDPQYEQGVRYYGVLNRFDLITGEWDKPVLVGDCQSRSDMILYDNELYMVYAPTDRNHLGILKINREDLAKSECILQADMLGSCFYPFMQYFKGKTLGLSYTIDRKHIRLATFELSKYL